jgi:plasmid stabilization system protein ParE
MAYLVNITPRAERDFASLYNEIHAGDSDAALKWYRGLKEVVLTLEEQSNRCPATPEKRQLRHLLYDSKPHIYRVIYRVMDKQKRVDVLHVRHGARKKLKSSDLNRQNS